MDMRWELRQKAYDRLYDFSQETFTGIRVIKAFVKETQELHAFAKVARKNQEVNVNFTKISMAFDCAIGVIIALALSCILGFGGWFAWAYSNGHPIVIFGKAVKLDPGQLASFIGLFDLLIWPMMALGQIVTMRSRAKTSLDRITHYLDEPEEIHDSNGSVVLENCKGGITFNNLSFAYPGSNKESLKNISLEIKPGELIGVVGKIGCGKTTLVDSLLRLYNYEPNSILIDGIDIMSLTIDSVRNNVAYVPQDNFLFSDTIKNNICFANIDMDLDKTIEAAKFSYVDNDIQNFVNKYDTVSGERGVTLSGGQKQRISIARAYIKESPILIMDDSVSAVDVKTEETILNNIRTLRKGKTTILVASRVSTVSSLDRIIVLNNGEIEAFDTPKKLYEISPTYQRMVDLQKLEAELKGGN
jgi:ATP-binding cassette subfamily B protein